MTDEQLTAEQKVRLALSGDPFRDPVFRHDGEEVIRWLTGGSLPDAWVTFHNRGDNVEVWCAACRVVIGWFDADSGREHIAGQLAAVRQAGHSHGKPPV